MDRRRGSKGGGVEPGSYGLTRREFLKAGTIGAATAAYPSCGCGEPSFDRSGKRPNVILVLADDLGFGDVGFNGNRIIQTPELDEMARAGMHLRRFYAGGPVCSPTRGTCLTGRHYFRYGIFSASEGYLPSEEWTLARACKTEGYATGFFGKWHLAPISRTGPTMPEYEENRGRKYAPPWNRDYDECFATECNVPTWNPAENLDAYKWVFRLPFWHNGEIVTSDLHGPASRIVMDRVIPFIRSSVLANRPFLATVWFHEPHEPVVAGPEYRSLYREFSNGEQHYYGCITAMDEQIGRLRRELRALGIADDTMIWFCSDNGPEGMTPHGEPAWCRNSRGVTGDLRGRKRSLFDGGLLGPAILEWPGHVDPGQSTSVPSSTLDYLPTVLDLLGKGMPDDRPLDGTSLLPLISNEAGDRSKPIPFWFVKAGREQRHGSPRLALVDNNRKLLTNLTDDTSGDLLFDLSEDREERINRASDFPEEVKRMRAHLRDWAESCRRSHSGADYPGPFEPVNRFPQ